MDNLSKIKTFSRMFRMLISLLLFAVPVYYTLYWIFLNDLPSSFISVNIETGPAHAPLPPSLRLAGFAAGMFPLAALLFGMVNIRKLFLFYSQGNIFSFDHVQIFKKISRALLLWVFFSIVYASVNSVLFSLSNPPGERVLSIGIGSPEITVIVLAGIVSVIAWVMDEGRILAEDQKLTV